MAFFSVESKGVLGLAVVLVALAAGVIELHNATLKDQDAGIRHRDTLEDAEMNRSRREEDRRELDMHKPAFDSQNQPQQQASASEDGQSVSGPVSPRPAPAETMQRASPPMAVEPVDNPERAATYPPIDNAIQAALGSGLTATWRGGGRHGYVVVSASQDYTSETCRTVVVTTVTGGDQSETSARMWCRSATAAPWLPR